MDSTTDNDHVQDRHNSSERTKDITSYDLGIRSYECVFCKRGFTTAQALGGHMNIHRKDRARPKLNSSRPSSPPLLNHENNNPTQITCDITANDHHHHQLSSQVGFHQSLTPPNSSSSSNPRFLMDASQHGFLSACHKENWCGLGLGLQSGIHSIEEMGTRSPQRGFNIHHQAAEEVDLELRLGHLNP